MTLQVEPKPDGGDYKVQDVGEDVYALENWQTVGGFIQTDTVSGF